MNAVHVKILTDYTKGMRHYDGGKKTSFLILLLLLKIHNGENYSQ